MIQIIYNSSAVCFLQLQYVQTFHNIKHFNMKSHGCERSTIWTLKVELICTHNKKHTIQKLMCSWYSVTRSHETLRNGTVAHKTHTFTNPKSRVSCFGLHYWTRQQCLTEYILCRKCHTDGKVCGCLTSFFFFHA